MPVSRLCRSPSALLAPLQAVADGLDALQAQFRRPTTIPFPEEAPYAPQTATLGKMLFFDPRLSGKQNLSCASCHDPSFGFEIPLAGVIGATNKPLARKAPTVLNAAWIPVLFWDGRAQPRAAGAGADHGGCRGGREVPRDRRPPQGGARVPRRLRAAVFRARRHTAHDPDRHRHLRVDSGVTGEAVATIGGITGRIREIDAVAASISAAVGAQGAATHEIVLRVGQTADGTRAVTDHIAGVAQAADLTGMAAGDVLEAASDLSAQAEELRREVARFLVDVRAA